MDTDPKFSEVSDRIRRSHNMIVYNEPKSQSRRLQARIEQDKTELTKILSIMKVLCENFKFFRVGRFCAKENHLKLFFLALILSPHA